MEQNPSNVHYGWVCPFCLTVYAPLIKSCNCQTSITMSVNANIDPDSMTKVLNQYREGNT